MLLFKSTLLNKEGKQYLIIKKIKNRVVAKRRVLFPDPGTF
jgi:hypothetical protein